MSETPLALDPLDGRPPTVPCPFCKSKETTCALRNHKAGDLVGKPFWVSECMDCDAQGKRYFLSDMEYHGCESSEELGQHCTDMWNRCALASSPPQAPAPTSPEFQAWWESHIAQWSYRAATEEMIRDACAEAWAVARTPTAPPQEPAAPANLHRDQAWLEIQGAMEDNMLNPAQKCEFIASILKGILANPPKLGGYNG